MRRRFYFQKSLLVRAGLTLELRGICAVRLIDVVMIQSLESRNKMAVLSNLGIFPWGSMPVHTSLAGRFYAGVTEVGEFIADGTLNIAMS